MRWQRFFTVFLLVFCLSWSVIYGSESAVTGGQATPVPVEEVINEALINELTMIFSWLDETLMTQGLTWNELMKLSPTAQTDMQKSEAKLTELEQSYLSYKDASESRIAQLEKDLEQSRRWNWPVFFKGVGIGSVVGLIGGTAVFFAVKRKAD